LILRGIEAVANREGFGVLMANSAESQDQALRNLEMLQASRVSGVLLVPLQSDRRDLERLRAEDTPFVLLLRRFADDDATDYVITDNVQAGYLATQHLVEAGHTRIAHIAGPGEVSTAQDRIEGYRQALAEAGIAARPEHVVNAPYTLEGGEATARRFLTLEDRPTAIFAATDRQAIGVLKAAEGLGMRVPEDLALVGGDDIEMGQFLSVPLTTFRQRAYEIGERGAEILLARVRDQERGEDLAEPQQVVLAPHLVVRRSSGAANAEAAR
jgi:LacI family transcriptional regulator